MIGRIECWIIIQLHPVFTTKRRRRSFKKEGKNSRKNMAKIITKCTLLLGNTKKWRYWILLNLFLMN